jgi:hypothetical protein
MEWVGGIFLVLMLGLLLYSIIGTSLALRKKVQPSVDSFFDGLYALVTLRSRVPKRDPSTNHERE